MAQKKVDSDYGTDKRSYGLETVRFRRVAKGFVLESKLTRFVLASVSTNEFKAITGVVVKNEDDLMVEVEAKLRRLSTEELEDIYSIKQNQGIVPALRKLYETLR